jgi:hypothetical protein
MAVTIAETSGHVTETELKSPLSPPVTMRRNDRSHSPKYAVNDRSWLYRPFCKSLFLSDRKTGLTAAAGEQLKVRMHQLR